MTRALDAIYDLAGGLAALAILAICGLVAAQVGLNIVSRLAGPGFNATIPSYADFAGFLLAAASFLALAHTLRRGGHIRVALLADRLPASGRWGLELAVLALAAGFAAYATGYFALLVQESRHFGDMSRGIVAVPLWIPQVPVLAGLALLTLALLHTLVESLLARRAVILSGATE